MKRELAILSASAKKDIKTKYKAIPKKSVFIVACVVLLAISYFISNSQKDEKDRKIAVLEFEVIRLKDCLECNVSQIMNLTTHVTVLNGRIIELEATADEKTVENQKLKQQVRYLNDAFRVVEAELNGLMKSEQIYLLVDRLRNPYYPPD